MSENAAADFKMLDLRGIEWHGDGGNRTPSGIRVTADNSMACSAYTACIRVISDAVSSLPLHVYERLANGGKAKAPANPGSPVDEPPICGTPSTITPGERALTILSTNVAAALLPAVFNKPVSKS